MSALLETALSKVMSAEAYAICKHDTPYVFDVQNKTAALYYFGARHSADPDDIMFSEIHDALADFKPEVVFVEGMQTKKVDHEVRRMFDGMSYTDAIARGGEPVYTAKLADEHGILWRSAEPDDADLYAHLVSLPGFSKSHIAAWHTLHLLPQWQRREEIVNFKDYTEPYRKTFERVTHWADFDYSYEYAISFVEEVLGKPLRLEHRTHADMMVDPIPWPDETVEAWVIFKRISKASSAFRDEEIVRQVGGELLEGKRVFVVYGASHAFMQEPAFRFLLGEHNEV